MSPFLRTVLAQREREQEARILTSRGRELYATPRDEELGAMRANCSRGKHARGSPASERDAAIVAATKAYPSYSPSKIAEMVETTHTTVIRVQRREGLYRAPVRDNTRLRDGGRWVMP